MERSQDNKKASRHKEKKPLDVVGVISVITISPSTTPACMALAVKGSHESQPSTQTITFIGKDLDQREVFPHEPLMVEIVVEDRNLQKGMNLINQKSKHWDLVALGDIVREKTLNVDSLDMREELKECRTEPIDQVKPVVLDERRPKRTINIGVDMDPSFVARLENCLMEHKDIFAWCLVDMPGINPEVACHRLIVNPNVVPIRQKVQQFGVERTAAIEEEVAKLKEAGFIQEIIFSKWLSNMVMVKKANEKWRMYNQIPMAKEDRDKTVFIVAGKCVEVYVDDILVKSKSLDQHIEDMKQVFEVLKTHNMKLNPTECTFGVKAGKFLGFMLTSKCIEANLEKICVVLEMKPPSSIKEGYELSQVRKSENLRADALAKLASTGLAYPESNGQIEAANKAILESLKKKIGSAKGTWTELPYTLWVYRTMHKTPTGETSFNLTYDSKAVVPVEVKIPNYRMSYFNVDSNEQALRENLDLLEETRICPKSVLPITVGEWTSTIIVKLDPRTYAKETGSYER
ncbi:hypothetical protein SLEP1_g57053 [Rubroshorea leprosula]|uniref:Reverse transcriptase domain-containing protein n=1 Tax=Rubroshorea leprosula TaxID=152421 RepID=A0AAV5MLE0_9ROSI|nr:hypothetical protein SLEP1_g57053 [Rubroshorea leprosula]